MFMKRQTLMCTTTSKNRYDKSFSGRLITLFNIDTANSQLNAFNSLCFLWFILFSNSLLFPCYPLYVHLYVYTTIT